MTDATPTDDRIAEITISLSREGKLALVHGGVDPTGRATGYLPGTDLTPSLSMVDGPMGIRGASATAFPATLALAATWDPGLAREFGAALASEARGAGQDALLAPGVNVVRVPQCGRAFEYYSEDPFLTSRMGVGTVEGIQSGGVLAAVKHFVANNQEADRHHVSAEVSERALRETYLPAFEAAVRDAEVASVMAAYNRVNGTYATEHRALLSDLLKDEWGFRGFVVSDWWATMDGPAAAKAGLDLDMPGIPVYEWHAHGSWPFDVVDAVTDWVPKRVLAKAAVEPWHPANPNPNVLDRSPFGDPLRRAIEDGRVDESALDGKVRRILGQMARFGLFGDDRPAGALDAHGDLARRIAERGTVLLGNDGDVLPLAGEADVALVGPHVTEAKVGGGGSSAVDPTGTTSPAAGLRSRAEGTVTVERGIAPVGDPSIHGGLLPDLPSLGGGPDLLDARAVARDADVAVVVVRDLATEGEDRALTLPGDQDDLVTAVADAADRTVVVLDTAGMVELPWIDEVDALLETWYPGQADGDALAAVLYGDSDPSGRLPVTFGKRGADYPASTRERYPGVDGEAAYDEGVFVGYRHFDAAGIEPRFPFGHGRSYAEFASRDLTLDHSEADGGPAATAEVTVENVSDRAGRDVVQCYLGPLDPAVERPPRELVAFRAIQLAAGESRRVSLSLDRRDFSYYDEASGTWTVDRGPHEVLVGRSSRAIRERATVTV